VRARPSKEGGREGGPVSTCPVNTEGGTRRVQLVREGGGGDEMHTTGCTVPSSEVAHSEMRETQSSQPRKHRRACAHGLATSGGVAPALAAASNSRAGGNARCGRPRHARSRAPSQPRRSQRSAGARLSAPTRASPRGLIALSRMSSRAFANHLRGSAHTEPREDTERRGGASGQSPPDKGAREGARTPSVQRCTQQARRADSAARVCPPLARRKAPRVVRRRGPS
jgi:hypothetical protein